MTYDGPGPAWEVYESRHGRRRVREPDQGPQPDKRPRRSRAVLGAAAAVVVAAICLAVAGRHRPPAPAPESVISAQGYADLLTALRAGPGTEVTSVYLVTDSAQVHVVKGGRDQMWDYFPGEGLRLVDTTRATDVEPPFDAGRFDGARLADACAAAAQDVESTPDRCDISISPVDKLAHPAWVEVLFGAYTAYYDRAMRPVHPVGL